MVLWSNEDHAPRIQRELACGVGSHGLSRGGQRAGLAAHPPTSRRSIGLSRPAADRDPVPTGFDPPVLPTDERSCESDLERFDSSTTTPFRRGIPGTMTAAWIDVTIERLRGVGRGSRLRQRRRDPGARRDARRSRARAAREKVPRRSRDRLGRNRGRTHRRPVRCRRAMRRLHVAARPRTRCKQTRGSRRFDARCRARIAKWTSRGTPADRSTAIGDGVAGNSQRVRSLSGTEPPRSTPSWTPSNALVLDAGALERALAPARGARGHSRRGRRPPRRAAARRSPRCAREERSAPKAFARPSGSARRDSRA